MGGDDSHNKALARVCKDMSLGTMESKGEEICLLQVT